MHNLEMGPFWDPKIALFFAFGLRARFGVSAEISATTAISGIGPGAVRGAPASILSDFGCPRGSILEPFSISFQKKWKVDETL